MTHIPDSRKVASRMRSALLNAALVLASLAVVLGLAELALRLFMPLREVGPSFSVHDPVLGKRLKASFSTERRTPEFTMRISTNSLGFRGAEPRGDAAQPILFLGDSFTLGYGVNDGEEYPALVGAELRRRHGDSAPPILNAGIGDSGNGFWIKFLRTETEGLRPRLVAMQLLENDFADNINEGLFVLRADGVLEERPVPTPPLLRRLQPLVEAVPFLPDSHLLGLVRQVRLPQPRPAHAAPALATQGQALRPGDELTLRILERAVAMCAQRNWNMLGVVVGFAPARRDAVQAVFARHGAPVVLLPARSERPDLYYEIDGHWNAAGHAHAAQAIVAALERLGTIARPAQSGG